MCGADGTPLKEMLVIKPEQRIADIISKEAGVHLNPQVLKLIVKYNWRELAKAAHEIHDGQ